MRAYGFGSQRLTRSRVVNNLANLADNVHDRRKHDKNLEHNHCPRADRQIVITGMATGVGLTMHGFGSSMLCGLQMLHVPSNGPAHAVHAVRESTANTGDESSACTYVQSVQLRRGYTSSSAHPSPQRACPSRYLRSLPSARQGHGLPTEAKLRCDTCS